MKIHLKYKGLTVNSFGLPILTAGKNEKDKNQKTRRKYSEYKHFDFNYPNTSPRDMIVIYDFPSSMRSERDWFRYQLKGFNYIMIGKNLWVGPSPLPEDFIKYIKSIGIFNRIETLKLVNPYSKNKNVDL